MIKKFFKDYLVFGRRDRIGIIALVVLIVIIYLLPYLAPKPPPLVIKPGDIFIKEIDTALSAKQSFDEDESVEQLYTYQPSTGSN